MLNLFYQTHPDIPNSIPEKYRTIEDKQNNQGKIFIAKNRNGPDGMVYNIFMDTSNVNIKILPKNKKSFIANKIAQILLDKLIDDRNIN